MTGSRPTVGGSASPDPDPAVGDPDAAASADSGPRHGYVHVPTDWESLGVQGPGPFITAERYRRPDGTVVRWQSRGHRKRRSPAPGAPQRVQGGSIWWRPHLRGWWMAVLFIVGSSCFAAGGVASQLASSSRPGIGITFFVGSLFFTAAAYLQFSETVNVHRGMTGDEPVRRWRPASWEPKRIDWLAALVQFIGTLLFNISTFAAMNANLTTHQTNARVWSPDVFGSIAFLIASELAFAEVCHRWVCVRRRSLPWYIVAINLLGSVAFAISAVASLIEPASGEPVSARVANAGTAFGGLCFLVGALLLMPEAAHASSDQGDVPRVSTTKVDLSPDSGPDRGGRTKPAAKARPR
jgi:hypothetical protein